MKTLQVNALPINEVIADLAKELSSDFEVICDEYYLQLPTSIGTGHITGMRFKGGLSLLTYDCTFNETTEIQFIVSEVHPLKFLYVLDGTLAHRFENEEELHELATYQNAIVASRHHEGHILKFEAGVRTLLNSEEIDREAFQPTMECELRKLDKSLSDLLEDVEAKHSFYHKGYYTLEMADLFKKMTAFTESTFYKKIYCEGIAYHMLTEQILQYQDDLAAADKGSLLRSAEVRQLQEATFLIESNISEIETIPLLAKQVGLNVNKLQHGFQTLHRMTVNEYLQQTRVKIAAGLLKNTTMDIGEIAERVGIKSKSYFSKLFKNQYGVKPSVFRQAYEEKEAKKD